MLSHTQVDSETLRILNGARAAYARLRDDQRLFALEYAATRSFVRRGGEDGDEYLISQLPKSQGRKTTSLGRRTPEVEERLAEYSRTRNALRERIRDGKRIVGEYRLAVRDLRAGRVPFYAGEVLRALDKRLILGETLTVAGGLAMAALEARAGVWLAKEHLTGLRSHSAVIQLRGDVSAADFIDMLRDGDATFDPLSNRDDTTAPAAVNQRLVIAELLPPAPPDAQRIEAIAFDSRGWPLWLPAVEVGLEDQLQALLAGRSM